MERFDAVVVGGGIVGLATAHALLADRPGLRLAVVEKEPRLAAHQTGRNSGVIHSGIYYRPGSLKARLAVDGRQRLVRFCEAHGVPYDMCGKVIVAVDPSELGRLRDLEDRACRNGVAAERIGPGRLAELEPYARGVEALHVTDTGVVDFVAVTETLARLVTGAGGRVLTGREVTSLSERDRGVVVETARGTLEASCVVNCAGLQSDLLGRDVLGPRPDVRIVPFRGEYHELVQDRRFLVRHLIYPVPDPAFPFLGVHFTRGIDGGVHAGPNAVLALAREGYSWRVVDRHEVLALLRFPGMRPLARRYWRTGAGEVLRSLSRRALARALRRLVPEVRRADLVPAPAGVRAQALGADGSLFDDFVIRETPRIVHVLNAPSPAATASLAIGAEVAARLEAHLPGDGS